MMGNSESRRTSKRTKNRGSMSVAGCKGIKKLVECGKLDPYFGGAYTTDGNNLCFLVFA